MKEVDLEEGDKRKLRVGEEEVVVVIFIGLNDDDRESGEELL